MVYVVALCGVFGLGMCFALLGSISVKLMPRLNIDEAKFGSLVSVFMICCLIASLVVGVTMDQVGFKAVAIIGFALAALCMLVLGNAKNYGAVLFAVVLLGFAAMALNTVGNVLGTTKFREFFEGDRAAANNMLNVFFGLGLFTTPFLISFLFQKTSYAKGISVLAVIILIPVIFSVVATYPKATGFTLQDAFSLLKEGACIVAALVLFCYIALEASFTNWLAPFGKEIMKGGKELEAAKEAKVDASAQRLLSVFAICMMIGRLLTSVTGLAGGGTYTIAGAAVVAAVIILGMMAVKGVGLAFMLAALSGLAFAPCFPTTVGVAFDKFGGESGSLFGIIFAVGLAGAVIVPKAIGNVARGSSIQKSLKLLLLPCVLLIGLALLLGVVKGPAEGKAPTTQPETKAAPKTPGPETRAGAATREGTPSPSPVPAAP